MELTIKQALQQGVAAHRAGKLQEAERLYNAILQVQPNHPDAKHNLGIMLVSVNKADAALPLFKAALDADPKKGQFWLSYVDALIKAQQFEKAEQFLEQAKKQSAIGEKLNALEAQLKSTFQKRNIKINEKRKELTAAKKEKKKKNQKNNNFNPTDTELNSLLLLYQNRQFVEVEKSAVSLTKRFPNHPFSWKVLGAVLQETGRPFEAENVNKKLVALSPQDPEAHSNLGVTLHELGRLEEAMASYAQAIALKPDFAEVHNNLGNTLNQLGKLEEAEMSCERAIALKPHFAEAHSNLGNTLLKLGRLDEAEGQYMQTLALRPDYAEAHNNLGNTVKKLGRLDEAEASYTKAITLKSDYFDAYYNLGHTLIMLDRRVEAAASYKQAIALKPEFAKTYYHMGNALEGLVLTEADSDLEQIIITILDKETCVRPADISQTIISLLKFEPLLQKALEKHLVGVLMQTLQETMSDLSDIPILLKYMSVCPVSDPELESFLLEVRSCLLLLNSEGIETPEGLSFQSAIALQCFTNEYVYSQTTEETNALKKIELAIEKGLSIGQQPSAQSILCMASYKALYEYKWCKLLSINPQIEEVFTRQLLEPEEEVQLRSDIPTLHEITNKVSSRVREQYEANPYPRWVNLGLETDPKTVSETCEIMDLRLYNNAHVEIKAPKILIAGCGTGQHSVGTASRFKNSEVLAVDLSLSSLAYAKRKTEGLGIRNIEYMQADILDLRKLEGQFDIIESVGVLHHMDDPMAGWRILVDCLSPSGLMKIGLYSELARQHIVNIRGEIDQVGIEPSDDSMRSFRNSIINSDKEIHKKVRLTSDFYSLSPLRDLLFHVQEHRFSIPQIKEYLDELGLNFCGFENPNVLTDFKRGHSDPSSLFDLDKWHFYEKVNPDSFYGMYQFWCQKIA